MSAPGRAGELVWRRHGRTSNPSRHALRTTCMELLPIVEMYCKYELQDDCSNLRELMVRFDSEAELQTHELGRSLLHMLDDDDAGMEMYAQRMQLDAPSNPFDSIRTRLAEIDSAFRALQPQVRLPVDINLRDTLAGVPAMALGVPNCLFPMMCRNKNFICQQFICASSNIVCLVVVCLAWSSALCVHLRRACIPEHGIVRSHLLCHFWRPCDFVPCTEFIFFVHLDYCRPSGSAAIPAGSYQPAHFPQASMHVRTGLCN